MSIRNKYIKKPNDYQEFDIASWWYKTTVLNTDVIVKEMTETFNNRFGHFLVWCDIVPYFK